MSPAALFSWKLFINNSEIYHFGDMRMTCSCDGMGTEGVVSAMFSFSVPVTEFTDPASAIPGGAEIVLQKIHDGSVGDTRVFYVSSKSSDDVKVTVKCYDRMTYTECDFPCTDEDFIDSNGKEKGLSVGTVLDRITEECGLNAILFDTVTLAAIDFDMPKSMLAGHSCRDVLSALSQVLCGYFAYDGLHARFIAIGAENENGDRILSEKHERIRNTSYIEIKNLYMTDSSGKTYGGASGGSGTITIDSQLASADLYEMLSGRIGDYFYSGWDCNNAILSGIPYFPSTFIFDDEENPRYANYYDVQLSSDGIVGSIGRNAIDEGTWVYKGRTQRELAKRYSEGDTWGNVKITKTGGLKFVYRNENK